MAAPQWMPREIPVILWQFSRSGDLKNEDTAIYEQVIDALCLRKYWSAELGLTDLLKLHIDYYLAFVRKHKRKLAKKNEALVKKLNKKIYFRPS